MINSVIDKGTNIIGYDCVAATVTKVSSYEYTEVDDDGNEDMFIGGQRQSEQGENQTRVLGKYVYDKGSKGMALETLKEVDAVLFLVDSVPDKGPGDAWIIEKLKEVDTPRFLVINKIDLMEPDEYLRTFEYYQGLGIFKEIYGISAKNGVHVQDVIDGVAKVAPEGPQYFPEDMITDHPERFLTAEIIREKLLLYLEEEVPHGVAVEIESFEEGEDITRIGAVIYCERKSHKSIIIGKGGRKLKGVGKAAREDIEKLLGCKVFLSLWVKIKERWRDDDIALTNFGYREKS